MYWLVLIKYAKINFIFSFGDFDVRILTKLFFKMTIIYGREKKWEQNVIQHEILNFG